MNEIITGLLLLICLSVLVAEEDDRVVVETALGKISGFKEKSTKGNEFYSFHSVPYAQPPVGNLRLKNPVPNEGWSGIRDGSVIPPSCPQADFLPVQKRQPYFMGDEDCLYLSIFTSEPSVTEANLPVMVFIHGGAFFGGCLNEYSPYVLMDEDIVFVLLQYRLGVLGFLSTEDDIIPGNFGVKDQTLALQWIQNHIHNFGGDKSRVTIFGESAGGSSVHFHIISPHSAGLFSGGILQSGTLLSPWAMGGAYTEAATYTGDLFGCPNTGFSLKAERSAALLSCLQTVDVVNLTMVLLDTIHWNYNPILFGPRVDGDYIPDEPAILMKEGRYNKVFIISGINADEGGLFTAPMYSVEGLKSDLVEKFNEYGPASLDITTGDDSPLELSRRIFDYYVGGVKAGEEDADNLCKMFGDWHFIYGHDVVAKLHTQNESPNKFYLYELDHRGQHSYTDFFNLTVGKHWISHVDIMYYQFTGGNTPWEPLERDEDLRLRDIITKMWYNFASTGNPTPDDSLGFTWTPISADYFGHLSLKPTPTMEDDKRQEVRKFLESLPTKQNYLLNPDLVLPHPAEKKQEVSKESKWITSPKKYEIKDEL